MAHVSVSETTLAPPVPAPVLASGIMMTSVGSQGTPVVQCVAAEETVSAESVSVMTMIRVGENTGENIVSALSGCVRG